MKMLSGVLVLGRVATAYMAADKTEPEMNPRIAHFQTLFTSVRFRFNVFDFSAVFTGGRHLCALSDEQRECTLGISCRQGLR